jgi:succinate dehydrogenase cytochrome b subunit
VQSALATPLGRIALFGSTLAFFWHFCGGTRHLAWDAVFGFELRVIYASGWAVVAASVALTMAAWIAALFVAW